MALRLVPCLRAPSFEFVVDAAYHERLVRETVAAGRLPAIDRLSNPPHCRRTSRELPVGLYGIGALAVRGLGGLGAWDAKWSLALLVALCGGLIAIPVWLGARAVFQDPRAAVVAAVVAAFLPAHVLRSCGYWLRYDAPGTLLAAAHGALALAALSSPRTGARRGMAIASAACLVAALWLWRVAIVVLAIELAFVTFRIARRGAEPALRELWLAIVIIGTAGTLSIEYLRVQHFVLSPPWLASIGCVIVLCVPWLGSNRRRFVRSAALFAVVVLALAIGPAGSSNSYAALPGLISARLGLGQTHDGVTALMLQVEELYAMKPWAFVAGTREFFLLGAWLLAAPALFRGLGPRSLSERAAAGEPAPMLLAFLTAGLAIATLLFNRFSVVLAPFAAIVMGGLGARFLGESKWQPSASGPPRGSSRARAGSAAKPETSSPVSGVRRALPIAFGLSAVATIAAGCWLAFVGWSRLLPDERLALEFLREHTPQDAVVLSTWDEGYDVQSHAMRATVMDGLLESEENRLRIVAVDRALMDPTPALLEQLCERYGARWLLLPPPTYLHGVATVAGDPVAGKIERGEPLIVGVDTRHVFMDLTMDQTPVPGFRLAFRAGNYRVFEREPTQRPR